jgi:muconolactone delta-isomerase
MNEYMVTASLPEYFSEDFLKRVSAQRGYMNELLLRNVLLSYSISEDANTMWMVFSADSDDTVEKILQVLPLRNYVCCRIEKLFTYQTIWNNHPALNFQLN